MLPTDGHHQAANQDLLLLAHEVILCICRCTLFKTPCSMLVTDFTLKLAMLGSQSSCPHTAPNSHVTMLLHAPHLCFHVMQAAFLARILALTSSQIMSHAHVSNKRSQCVPRTASIVSSHLGHLGTLLMLHLHRNPPCAFHLQPYMFCCIWHVTYIITISRHAPTFLWVARGRPAVITPASSR